MDNKDVRELYTYLNDEINSLEQELKRPGWTKWALLGSIAALIWILIGHLDEKIFEFNIINLYLMMLILFFDVLTVFLFIIQGKSNTSQPDRFIYSNNSLNFSRISIIIFILKSIFFLIAIKFVPSETSILSIILLYVIALINLLLFILVFIFSYLSIPIKLNSSSYNKSLYVLIVVICIYAIPQIKLLEILYNNQQIQSWNEFKIAIIIYGIFYLLILFSKETQIPNMLNILYSLRRRMIFENQSYESVKEQIEITILGYKGSSILTPMINDYIEAINEHNSIWDSYIENQNSLANLFTGIKNEVNEDDRRILTKMIDSLNFNFIKAEDVFENKVQKTYKRLVNRMNMLILIFPSDDYTYKEFNIKIVEAQSKIKGKLEEVKENRKELRKTLDEFISLNS